MLSGTDVLVDSGYVQGWNTLYKSLSSFHLVRRNIAQSIASNEGADFGATTILILGAHDSTGHPSDGLIRRFRRLCPHVSIWLCGELQEVSRLHLPAYARAGADMCYVVSIPQELEGMSLAMNARLRAPPSEEAIRQFVTLVPDARARAIGLYCLRNAFEPYPGQRVADWFDMDRTTINRRLASVGLPTAGTIWRCGQLLHAFELQRHGISSRVEVARRLGYESTAALRAVRARLMRTLSQDPLRCAMLCTLLAEFATI